jgi:integrase
MGGLHRNFYGEAMARRNHGPKLKFFPARGSYYILWTENRRSRERSTCTADSAKAQIVFAQFLQQLTQSSKSRDPGEVLVTEALTIYLERLESLKKDCERAAYATISLSKYFAGKTLAEAPALCEGYQHWRKVSASTVRRDLGVLQSAVKCALQMQIITRVIVISRPPESPARERWLSRSEAARLIAAALGFQPVAFDIVTRYPLKWKRVAKPQYHLALFILIGLYTGRRKEAILSLRWPKIDLTRRKIDFRRDGLTETKKKRGQCAIPPRLLSHLRRSKKLEFDIGHVIQWEAKPVVDIKTSFNNAVDRAFLEDVSPHTLKHTAATWLMQSGKDPFKISDFLATSVPTLLKHYGHHNPEHQSEIAEAISARPQRLPDNFRIMR